MIEILECQKNSCIPIGVQLFFGRAIEKETSIVKKRQARMDLPKNLSIFFCSIEGSNQQLLYFNALDISASSVPYFFTFPSYILLSKKRPRIIVKSE